MTTRTAILALALATASISALASTSAAAWSGPAHRPTASVHPVNTTGTWHPAGSYRPTTAYPSHIAAPWRPSWRPHYVPGRIGPSYVRPYRPWYPSAPVVIRAPSHPVFHAPSYRVIPSYVPAAPAYGARPIAQPCTCEAQAPAPEAIYVQPAPVVEMQPAAIPCDCEAPAPQAQRVYAQPQEQAPAEQIEEQVPAEQVPAEQVQEQAPAEQVEEQVPTEQVEEQMPVEQMQPQMPMDRQTQKMPLRGHAFSELQKQ